MCALRLAAAVLSVLCKHAPRHRPPADTSFPFSVVVLSSSHPRRGGHPSTHPPGPILASSHEPVEAGVPVLVERHPHLAPRRRHTEREDADRPRRMPHSPPATAHTPVPISTSASAGSRGRGSCGGCGCLRHQPVGLRRAIPAWPPVHRRLHRHAAPAQLRLPRRQCAAPAARASWCRCARRRPFP